MHAARTLLSIFKHISHGHDAGGAFLGKASHLMLHRQAVLHGDKDSITLQSGFSMPEHCCGNTCLRRRLCSAWAADKPTTTLSPVNPSCERKEATKLPSAIFSCLHTASWRRCWPICRFKACSVSSFPSRVSAWNCISRLSLALSC